jgi:hypothetical protein
MVRSDRRLGVRRVAEELDMGICLQESVSMDFRALHWMLKS